MTEENHASRFDELDASVKDMLCKLEPEEVTNLKYVATIPKAELMGMMKFFRDFKAFGKIGRGLIITMAAIFLGMMALSENIAKLFLWIKGGPPS